MRRPIASALAAVLLLLVGQGSAHADYQALVGSAVAHLEASQNADGSWGDRSALRDTVEVVWALHQGKPQSASLAPAIAWLNAASPKNEDLRARRTALLARLGQDVASERSDLLDRIGKDHGWGITGDYRSDMLTTLQTLAALGDSPLLSYQSRLGALGRILSLQREDGGFCYTEENQSSVFLTAEVIRALSQIAPEAQVTEAMNRAGGYLLAQMHADGSLGSSLYEALAAADALRRTQVLTPGARDLLYGFLGARQDADGSFGTTAYETALAVGLFGGSRANLSLDQASVRLSKPNPGPGEAITITVTVHNHGDQAAENILVELFSCDGAATLGGLIGQATLARVEALGAAEVSIPHVMPAAAGIFNLCVVIDGANTVLELSERDNATSVEIVVSDGEPPVISALAADQEFISPNGDGVQDAVTLSYRLSENATVSLSARSEEGFVETVARGISQAGGDNTLVWGGEGERDARVSDGTYTLILAAADSVGNVARASIQVTVDNNRLLYRYTNQVAEIVPRNPYHTIFSDLDTTADGRYLVSQSYFSGLRTFIQDFDSGAAREATSGNLQNGVHWGVLPNRGLLVKPWVSSYNEYSETGMRLLELDTGEEVQRISGLPYHYGGSVASPDEKVLYSLQFHYPPPDELPYITEVHALDLESGENRVLTSFEATTLGPRRLYYSTEGGRLYMITPQDSTRTKILEFDPVREEGSWVYEFDAATTVDVAPMNGMGALPRLMRNRFGRLLLIQTVEGSGAGATYSLLAYDVVEHRMITVARRAATGDASQWSVVAYLAREGARGVYFTESITLTTPYGGSQPVSSTLYHFDSETGATQMVAANLPPGSLYLDTRNNRALISTTASYGLWSVDFLSGQMTQAVSYLDLNPTNYLSTYGLLYLATPDGRRVFMGQPGSAFMTTGDLWRIEFSADVKSQERYVRLEDVSRPLEDRRLACFTGVAMDTNFQSWRLEYLSLDHPLDGWRVLTSSLVEASDGRLGCLDTSGLPSGLLVFRLVVTDRAGNVMTYGGGSSDLIEYYQAYGTVPENIPGETFLFYNESVPSVFAALPARRQLYLSPNGDGALDSLELTYGLKGQARVSAWVTGGDGGILAELVSGAAQDVGTYAIRWDGSVSGGALAGDGEYLLHLRDDFVAEQPETITFRVTVDTRPPTLALTDPQDRSTVAGVVAIRGSAADANLKEFTIRARPLGETGWRTLASSSRGVDEGVLCSWDTTALSGDYELRITATDEGANSSARDYIFTVDNLAPDVALLEPVTGAIVFGSVRVSAASEDADLAAIRLAVREAGASSWTPLATLLQPPFQAWWDTGAAAFPHGAYEVRAIALDHAGNVSAPAVSRVFLDKNEPSSTIVVPAAESVVRGTVAVRAESDDGDLASVAFLIRSALGSGYSQFAVDASPPYVVGLNSVPLSDGVYYLASRATDIGGLTESGRTVIPVTVDNTPPTVAISSPLPGQVVGGDLAVAGTFGDAHPGSYVLSYVGPQGGAAREFASGEGARSGSLGALDTRGLVNGDYRLLLRGTDAAGNAVTVERDVTVANARPEILDFTLGADQLSPNGDGVRDVLEVSYTVSASAFVTVEARNGAGALVALAQDHAPRGAGAHTLAWDLRGSQGQILPDGSYTLTLRAADEFGNESSAATSFLIDTVRPAVAIQGPLSGSQLYGLIVVRGTVAESSFQSYRVLVAPDAPGSTFAQVAASAAPPLDGTFVTWDATGRIGGFQLKVEAADKAGNVGSALVTFTLVDPAPALEVAPLAVRHLSGGVARLSALASRPGALTVAAIDDGSQVVRQVATNLAVPVGPLDLEWDLAGAGGARVADGRYAFSLSFLDAVTGLTSQVRSEAFTLDTLPPAIAITAPAAGATLTTTAAIEGTIAEVNFGGFAVWYGSGTSPTLWTPLASSSERPATARLGDWDISMLSGLYTVKVEATDLAGNHASQTVTVNAAPLGTADIAAPSLSELVISPNGDGVKDTTALSFSLLRDGRVTVWIENADGLVVSSPATDAQETAGPKSLTWEGTGSAGAPLPDGSYSWYVKVAQPDGSEHTYAAGQCVVDATPPALAVSAPAAGATVIDTVEVRGSLVESNFATLEVAVRAEGAASATALASFRNPPTSALWGRWDTGGLSGAYQVILTATDRAGNGSLLAIPVTVVDGRLPFLGGVSVSTPLISPNGDGHLDTVSVGFTLARAMTIEVAARNASGATVRLLQSASALPDGEYAISWNGRNGAGAVVADGQYSLVVTASDALSGRSERATVSVALDATPPSIAVDTPAAGATIGRTLTVGGVITDARLDGVTVAVDSGGGYAAIEPVAITGNRFSATTVLDLAEGQIGVKVSARDQGGLTAERSLTVSLDTAPPVVSLGFALPPQSALALQAGAPEGAALGASQEPVYVKGAVTITFSAVDSHFKEALVQYGSPAYWSQICRITASTPSGTCRWTPYFDGATQVRIAAEDMVGNRSEIVLPVVVDNYPPYATLYEPTASSVLSDTLTARGSVYDSNLLRARMEFRKAVAGEPWQLLFEGADDSPEVTYSPVEPIDSPIEVHLFAVDRAGNTKEQFVRCYMDNVKPPAPTGLTAVIGPTGRPVLSWNPVPIGDLMEYRVYRDARLSYQAAAGAGFTDSGAADGRYRYQVTAVDVHGNEGPRSAIAEVTVDLTPPVVELLAPLATGTYGGAIEIRGTAAAEDLAWYRIEVGAGSSPASWEQVGYSTLGVSDAALGRWWSFPAQGTHTLRVTAEDLRHNPASASVTFSVDNEPPASPAGVAVHVEGGTTIRLSWTPNGESDLAGYRVLLYGNAVHPELLGSAEFAALGMPDGVYRYAVVAVDRAGNSSRPSATVEVDLDNRPPAVVVVQPANGAAVRDQSLPLSLVARSNDYDVILVEFQYRPASSPSWTRIGTVVTEIYGTAREPITLGDIGLGWNVSGLPEGDYFVRAVGTDRHAQVDGAPQENLVRMRKPPSVPLGLAGTIQGRQVSLTWQANGEPDLAGYRVYRDGLPAGQAAAPSYVETLVADGTFRYTVTAVDAQGDESDPSAPVAVLLDTAAPVVAVASPVQGAKVAGTVTVSGTVSEPDLASFLLEFSRDGGATWEPIRRLTDVASSSFSLAWPTAGLDGAALLRAQAEDRDGNRGFSPPVAVTLDNTPPAIPGDLAVLANDDGTVRAAWAPVGAPDLAGYRIHAQREGELDYQTITPAPVAAPAYDLVSGLEPGRRLCLIVSAVDDVGNESDGGVPGCVVPGFSRDPVAPWICSPWDGFRTADAAVDIHGYAPPHSKVVLFRNDAVIDSAVAPSTGESRGDTVPREGSGVLRRSPDGAWLVYRSSSTLWNAVRKEQRYLPVSSSQFQEFTYDSSAAMFSDGYSLKRYELATGVLTELARFSGGRKLVRLWPSPAGPSLAALFQTGVSYEIQLLDSRSGAGATVATGLGASPLLSWRFDGSHFFFTRGAELVRYSLAAGTLLAYPFGQSLEELWGGQGEAEVFYRAGTTIRYRNLLDGSTAALSPGGLMGSAFVPWAPGFLVARLEGAGYLFEFVPFRDGRFGPATALGATDSYSSSTYGGGLGTLASGEGWHYTCASSPCSYTFFSLPGRFTFSGVNLLGDTTYFAAADENAAGERSPLSAPVSVLRSAGASEPADIFLSHLRHEPGSPLVGDTVRIHARLTCNASRFFRNVTVRARVRQASGAEETIGERTLAYFYVNNTQDFSFSWTPAAAGEYEYSVELVITDNFDADVPENNLVTAPVSVRRTDATGTLALGQARALPGETASATVTLVNPGAIGRQVSYALALQTLEGGQLLTIAAGTVALAAGEQRDLPHQWVVPELSPGLYLVQLTASESGWPFLSQAGYLEVLGNGDLNAALFVEDADLRCGEQASLLARIGNSSTNAIFDGVEVVLSIGNASGGEVHRVQRALAPLYPYATATETFGFSGDSCTPGQYRATLSLFAAGQLKATKSVSFAYSQPPPALELAGRLTVAPRKIARGMDLTLSYEVRNTGLVAAVAVPVRIDVLDPSSGLSIVGFDLSVDCAPGDAAVGQVLYPEVLRPEGFYPVALTTSVAGSPRLLDQGGFEIGDLEAPAIAVLEPRPQSAHPRIRPLAIEARVTDNLSGIASVEYRVAGRTDWAPLAYQSGHARDAVYAASLDVSAWVDGDYALEVRAADRDGNGWTAQPGDSNPVEVAFTLINLAILDKGATVVPRVLAYVEQGDDGGGSCYGAGAANPLYESALAGTRHRVVTDLRDFVDELESGTYNVFVVNGSCAESLNAEPTLRESAMLAKLRERAFAGAGVIFSRWVRFREGSPLPILREMTGNADFSRSRATDLTLSGTASGYGYLEGVATTGRSVLFTPERSAVIASLFDGRTGRNHAAVTVAPYGSGTCVFVGFNMEDSYYRQARLPMRALVGDLVGVAAPREEFPYPGGTIPLRIGVEAFSDVALRVEEPVPGGAAIVDAGGGTLAGGTLSWTLSLSGGETTGITYLLRLPETGLSIDAVTSLSYAEGAEYRLIAEHPWSLAFGFTLPDELWEIEALIGTLGLPGEAEEEVAALIGALAGNPRSTCAEQRASVRDTLRVIELIKDQPAGAAARLRLDRLLFYYQRQACHVWGEE